METTIGSRIAALRRGKAMKQEELAQMLGITAQAVSKWENDQTCPDISLLPKLAEILDVSIDELVSGKHELVPVVSINPNYQKTIQDMMLRIVVDSSDGDKVKVNIPMGMIQIAVDAGMEMPQITGNAALQKIDWNQILDLVRHGVMGNLVEVDSSDGDTVRIFVE